MRWTSGARWSAIGALVVLPASIQAQSSAPQLPVSLDRIRAALEEPPPAFQVPPKPGEKPIFRVEVRQPVWGLQPVEEERPFDPTLGLPSAGELLMDGIEKIHRTEVNYRRNRAERRARKEVEESLAALCAVRDCSTARIPK